MTVMSWVVFGWAASLAVVGGYVLVVIRRGRSLSRQVPPGDQRWM
jgi:hypothetical protein